MEIDPNPQSTPIDNNSSIQDLHKPSKKAKYIIFVLFLLVIIVTTGIFLWHFLQNKNEDESRINQAQSKYMYEPWKTYIDPDRDFSISIPSSWPIGTYKDYGSTSATGTGKNYAYETYTVTLGNPGKWIRIGQNVTASNFLDITINVNKPVSGDCLNEKLNTNISGFPAIHDVQGNFQTWHVNTNKAEYDIYPNYTGSGCGFACPQNYIAPNVSQSSIDANYAVINKIAYSFKPLNQKPYICR